MLGVTSENLIQVQRIHFVTRWIFNKNKKAAPCGAGCIGARRTQLPDPDWGGSLFWNLAARKEQ